MKKNDFGFIALASGTGTAAIGIIVVILGCTYPTVDDLRAYPDLQDVKVLQIEQNEFIEEGNEQIVEAVTIVGQQMTEEHTIQTPEHAEPLAEANAKAIALIDATINSMRESLAAANQGVRDFQGVQAEFDAIESAWAEFRANPGTESYADLFDLLVTGGVAALGGAGLSRFGRSRAEPAISDVKGKLAGIELALAVAAGAGKSVPSDS